MRSHTPGVEPSNSALRQTAFVAMGSNLGDRLRHLQTAVNALRGDPDVTLISVSPVYESPAHTRSEDEFGPPFLNAVIELSTSLDPFELLARLHGIERAAGRRREDDPRWAPRTLDLDLLIFGRKVIRSEQLTVPHPRLGVRRFVLRPWADLDADWHVPQPFNQTVGALLKACPDADRPVQTPFIL